ncbi:MAG: protein kinase [Polyangiaceae bacterium]|nr:protein kinase [Polyangiaceae bacterium]
MLIGGKYRLLKKLGEGAMGTVWSAVSTATGGQFAIKLIVRSEPELRARLLREAQACGAIRHKNVVQVYDVGTTDTGDPFLVMELLSGQTLASLLAARRRLPPEEACGIARDVARALAAAHAVPIVHRDLKPANIFLHEEPGEEKPIVKVVDFGVSKNLQASDGLRTVAGGAVGSPMYMSPEQARADRNLDHRADMWSLGVVLYEMLTGERPFGGDALDVVQKIINDPIPRVARRVRKIDPEIDKIVASLLTRDLDQRASDAAEVARQLDRLTLPAARDPLPSLMDTGGYDAPVGLGSPGLGSPRLSAASPGIGPSNLTPASPGVGSTDLRASSNHPALTPKSGGKGATNLSSAASAAEALHRSGSWGEPADDDGATIPIEPHVLESRLARAAAAARGSRPSHPNAVPPSIGQPTPGPPSIGQPSPSRPSTAQPPLPSPSVGADLDWGPAPAGGGTIPLSALGKPPVPVVHPHPVLQTSPLPAEPQPSLPRGTTMRMEAGHLPIQASDTNLPVSLSTHAPIQPAPQKSKKIVVGAVAVILVSVAATAAILLFGPKRVESASGENLPNALPTTTATAPPAPTTTAPATAEPTAEPQPTASPSTTAPVAKPAATVKPAATATPPKPTASGKTASTAQKKPVDPIPAPTPKTTATAKSTKCKSSFGLPCK